TLLRVRLLARNRLTARRGRSSAARVPPRAAGGSGRPWGRGGRRHWLREHRDRNRPQVGGAEPALDPSLRGDDAIPRPTTPSGSPREYLHLDPVVEGGDRARALLVGQGHAVAIRRAVAGHQRSPTHREDRTLLRTGRRLHADERLVASV